MNITQLTTDRLELAAPTPQDIPEIVRLANDYEVARTLARLPYPYGEKDAQYFLDEVIPVEPNWKVMRKSDEALLGFVGLKPVEGWRVVELGYWYGRAYWGHGYATESARAVVAHAFDDLGTEKILSGHFAINPASGRVLEKIGFRNTGHSEVYSLAADADLPHVDMVLEQREWSADAPPRT